MLIPMGILAASGAAPAGSYELIATTFGNNSSTSITFNSSGVWANYKHLQIRFTARTTSSSGIQLRLNGYSSLDYTTHRLFGEGTSTAQSSNSIANDRIYLNEYAAGSGATNPNQYGLGIIDILDVNTTGKTKAIRAFGGRVNSDVFRVAMTSGFIPNTDALTSITILGSAFTSASRFSIYGIKGA